MIKRTLYFGNPAYLSLKNCQLLLRLPEVVKNDSLTVEFKKEAERLIPIEDIGVIIIDNKQITITQGLLDALLNNNSAVIMCDSSRMPSGLFLPLCVNKTQSERFSHQLAATTPLKKNLWQQTIQAKVFNQSQVLKSRGVEVRNMLAWIDRVKSGDPDNFEARAAAYYWRNLMSNVDKFTRDRDGIAPNNLLNYGYAILRAIVARGLVASGLLPTFGIHHHNRYNAYCLADDIMEPYRPYVDRVVCDIMDEYDNYSELNSSIKSRLLTIPVIDVVINEQRSPLMIAVGTTTASLYKCYSGESRKILFPKI